VALIAFGVKARFIPARGNVLKQGFINSFLCHSRRESAFVFARTYAQLEALSQSPFSFAFFRGLKSAATAGWIANVYVRVSAGHPAGERGDCGGTAAVSGG
jgi:hypothetical protein